MKKSEKLVEFISFYKRSSNLYLCGAFTTWPSIKHSLLENEFPELYALRTEDVTLWCDPWFTVYRKDIEGISLIDKKKSKQVRIEALEKAYKIILNNEKI